MHFKKIVNLNISYHLLIAFLLRAILILYGSIHDNLFNVPYTDVDYKVISDAARYILNGNSPYERLTFRYSPLLAFLMIPNIVLNDSFGKWIFSIFDLIVGVFIHRIVSFNVCEYEKYKLEYSKKNEDTLHLASSSKKKLKKRKNIKENNFKANMSALIWLYNPLVFVISTRGNCDAIAGFLVLSTLYLLECKKLFFFSGLMHGFSIHFRLYPLLYSLALYMYLSKFSFYSTNYRLKTKVNKLQSALKHNERQSSKHGSSKNISNKLKLEAISKTHEIDRKNAPKNSKSIFTREYLLYLVPNVEQLKLMLGTLVSLSLLTAMFYYLYGYQFLYETYVYHLIRKDTRHNFSLYFYLQYLTAGIKNIGFWQRILTVLPQYTLILTLSVRYGLNKVSINFALLTITFVMITFNTVLTSQYFTWIMVVLPLCVWQIKMSKKLASVLAIAWLIAQAAWLLPAYLLEFDGLNTFLFIWIQGVSFFCANIAFLGRIIVHFLPGEE